MKPFIHGLCAAALVAGLVPALAADIGPYAVIGIGRTHYDADCSIFFSCNGGRAATGRLAGGYQFETFALEGWIADWGRAPIGYADDHVRLRSIGGGGAWHWHMGTTVQGVARIGAARVRQTRTTENFSSTELTLGLALLVDVAPKVAFELAWDATGSTGGSERIGTVVAQAVTGGLRLRF